MLILLHGSQVPPCENNVLTFFIFQFYFDSLSLSLRAGEDCHFRLIQLFQMMENSTVGRRVCMLRAWKWENDFDCRASYGEYGWRSPRYSPLSPAGKRPFKGWRFTCLYSSPTLITLSSSDSRADETTTDRYCTTYYTTVWFTRPYQKYCV